jgi:hemerythrin-like domain-containing protein
MALEENGGYLTPVIEMRPTLAADVERLRRDHQQMAEIMDTIHAALNDLNPQHRRSARECCYRIESLLSYVQHHERNENLLVTYVFTQDIGDHD